MTTFDADVLAYYQRGNEQQRLATVSRLEFVRTMELLERLLPAPPAMVLDVGGGSGGYAVPLAERGYDVHLFDPVPLHVDQARAAGLAHAAVGDARALDVPDEAADAVLLLGPLYHLVDRDDRVQALREAARTLRADGIVLAAVISRFASTYDGLLRGFLVDAAFEQIVVDDLASGAHRNPEHRPGWFTTAYFHHPDEIADEMTEAGFGDVAVVAIEGVGALLADLDEWLDDDVRRAALLRAIARVEAEPSVLGASSHIMAVGRRAGSGRNP